MPPDRESEIEKKVTMAGEGILATDHLVVVVVDSEQAVSGSPPLIEWAAWNEQLNGFCLSS